MSKLSDYLKRRGEKQNEFVRRSGLSKATVSRAVAGQRVKWGTMIAIAKHTSGDVMPNDWIAAKERRRIFGRR